MRQGFDGVTDHNIGDYVKAAEKHFAVMTLLFLLLKPLLAYASEEGV